MQRQSYHQVQADIRLSPRDGQFYNSASQMEPKSSMHCSCRLTKAELSYIFTEISGDSTAILARLIQPDHIPIDATMHMWSRWSRQFPTYICPECLLWGSWLAIQHPWIAFHLVMLNSSKVARCCLFSEPKWNCTAAATIWPFLH